MLASLNAIKTACGTNLENLGVKDFTVPDMLKLSMPACAGISEYAQALKTHMKKDGVHFTASGYSCLASGLSRHLHTLTPTGSGKIAVPSLNVAGSKKNRKQSFYWRGFVSPVGAERPFNHRAAYLQSHSKTGPPRGAGGGKWRGSTSCPAGPPMNLSYKNVHGRTPYMPRGGRGGRGGK